MSDISNNVMCIYRANLDGLLAAGIAKSLFKDKCKFYSSDEIDDAVADLDNHAVIYLLGDLYPEPVSEEIAKNRRFIWVGNRSHSMATVKKVLGNRLGKTDVPFDANVGASSIAYQLWDMLYSNTPKPVGLELYNTYAKHSIDNLDEWDNVIYPYVAGLKLLVSSVDTAEDILVKEKFDPQTVIKIGHIVLEYQRSLVGYVYEHTARKFTVLGKKILIVNYPELDTLFMLDRDKFKGIDSLGIYFVRSDGKVVVRIRGVDKVKYKALVNRDVIRELNGTISDSYGEFILDSLDELNKLLDDGYEK